MPAQLPRLCETIKATLTHERLLTRMDAFVLLQIAFGEESLIAARFSAAELPFAGVKHRMLL